MATSRIPFGKPMLQHFGFDKDWLNLNHGSFGACPLPVLAAMRKFQDHREAAPDRFIRYEEPRLLLESRQSIATMVNASVKDIVMIPNATTGGNIVLRNLVYSPGDKILLFSTSYGAWEKTAFSVAETTDAQVVRIVINYPNTSNEEILQAFRDAVAMEHKDGNNVKIAMFDTISSLPGVRMPFEDLTAACRELGVLSLIDGAHSVGLLPLDLEALNADFFVSNCHKWLFVPRACAFLHVPLRNQALIRTTIPTSHGWLPVPGTLGTEHLTKGFMAQSGGGNTHFEALFRFVGTLETSPYLCVPAAVRFRNEVCGGEAAIYEYSANLAGAGSKLVAKQLGTECMEDIDGRLTRELPMINVRLPLPGTTAKVEDGTVQPSRVIDWMSEKMIRESNAFIYPLWHGNAFWVRLSAQIYLELDDFRKGGEILIPLCKEAEAYQWN